MRPPVATLDTRTEPVLAINVALKTLVMTLRAYPIVRRGSTHFAGRAMGVQALLCSPPHRGLAPTAGAVAETMSRPTRQRDPAIRVDGPNIAAFLPKLDGMGALSLGFRGDTSSIRRRGRGVDVPSMSDR